MTTKTCFSREQRPIPFLNKTRQRPKFSLRARRPAPGGPPDDFIDTTAVDVPGSESLGTDFERQELRVIFETMDRNNVFYKMLAEEQIVRILFVDYLLCGLYRNARTPELARRGKLHGGTLCLECQPRVHRVAVVVV